MPFESLAPLCRRHSGSLIAQDGGWVGRWCSLGLGLAILWPPGLPYKTNPRHELRKELGGRFLMSLNTFLKYLLILGMFACINICILHVCSMPAKVRSGVRSAETGVKDDCGPPCLCQEPNPGPLQDRVIFTGPSLQLQIFLFVCF